jgi:hypothetical protein
VAPGAPFILPGPFLKIIQKHLFELREGQPGKAVTTRAEKNLWRGMTPFEPL